MIFYDPEFRKDLEGGLQTEKFLSAPDSANAPDRFIRQLVHLCVDISPESMSNSATTSSPLEDGGITARSPRTRFYNQSLYNFTKSAVGCQKESSMAEVRLQKNVSPDFSLYPRPAEQLTPEPKCRIIKEELDKKGLQFSLKLKWQFLSVVYQPGSNPWGGNFSTGDISC